VKRNRGSMFLPVALLGVLLLNACAANLGVASRPSAAEIYTAAAHTIAAQTLLTPSTFTLGPAPTLTANQTPSPTPRYPLHYFASVTPFVPSLSPQGALCDNSAYVSDVTFPDHRVVAPGTVFVKTWKLQNIGVCGWSGSYTLNFVYGDKMKGATTAIGEYVLPQQQVNVSVCLTAPNSVGKYTGHWQLANDFGMVFGARVFVMIEVKADITGTPTAVPTTTSLCVPTPTPTKHP